MRIVKTFIFLVTALAHASAEAEESDRLFTLQVPPEIEASGLLAHVLPRFALKTGRKAQIVTVSPDAAFVKLGPGEIAEGHTEARFSRGGNRYGLRLLNDDPDALLFDDWVASQAGIAAITGFMPQAGGPFTAVENVTNTAEIRFDGDAALGLQVAQTHCTRCHTVAKGDRANIGSTPSFMAIRALPDWAERFMAFYSLNPHPSFMRVQGISPDFDPQRPPALIPIELTQKEVEAVQAYAASLPPADLGAEVQSR